MTNRTSFVPAWFSYRFVRKVWKISVIKVQVPSYTMQCSGKKISKRNGYIYHFDVPGNTRADALV